MKSYSAQVENLFIQAGRRTNAHLPWANMDKEALTLQESRLNRWEDADDAWGLKDYIEAHGIPATNGQNYTVTRHPLGHQVVLVPRKVGKLVRATEPKVTF